jgi:TraX protein
MSQLINTLARLNASASGNPIDRPATTVSAEPNYYDLLKVVAIAAMIIDHVNDYEGLHSKLLTAVGRIAMPLFLFLVGYNRSTRIRGSLWLALVCIAPLQWELRSTPLPLNILFSVVASRLFFRWGPRFGFMESPQLQVVLSLAVVLSGPMSLVWEYGTIGMLWALYGRLRRERHRSTGLTGAVASVLLVLAYWPDFAGQHWLLIFAVGATCWILSVAPILAPLPRTSGSRFIQSLSRSSLWIYVGHFALLVLVSVVEHATRGVP